MSLLKEKKNIFLPIVTLAFGLFHTHCVNYCAVAALQHNWEILAAYKTPCKNRISCSYRADGFNHKRPSDKPANTGRTDQCLEALVKQTHRAVNNNLTSIQTHFIFFLSIYSSCTSCTCTLPFSARCSEVALYEDHVGHLEPINTVPKVQTLDQCSSTNTITFTRAGNSKSDLSTASCQHHSKAGHRAELLKGLIHTCWTICRRSTDSNIWRGWRVRQSVFN